MDSDRINLKTEHFHVGRNYAPAAHGRPVELEDGVYVQFTDPKENRYAYDALSTEEARKVGEALIALADTIEAEQPVKPTTPPEPDGWLVIVKFDLYVPAIRSTRGGSWRFASLDGGAQYTWEGLLKFVGTHEFTVLYPVG